MDDLISRQAAVAAIQSLYPDMPIINVCGSRKRWREKNKQYIECEFVINMLPSEKPKKGKWKQTTKNLSSCSNCGNCVRTERTRDCFYCPNCGADMREEDE